jgi:EAL domain-containing protein (putative c-di-GMP-specific phosphodiesterase class I)
VLEIGGFAGRGPIALRHIWCDQYQGYLFSKPVPAEEIERLLASPRPP